MYVDGEELSAVFGSFHCDAAARVRTAISIMTTKANGTTRH